MGLTSLPGFISVITKKWELADFGGGGPGGQTARAKLVLQFLVFGLPPPHASHWLIPPQENDDA